MSDSKAIVWFKNDLRLHDHEPLCKALQARHDVYPVYIFDERHFESTHKYGFAKTAGHRAKFLIESVANLKQNLKKRGSDLIVRVGKPEYWIPRLVNETGARSVYAHKESTSEELKVEGEIEKKLFHEKADLELFWGVTLYHIADLPFLVRQIPDVFTPFRKKVEKLAEIREPFPTPDKLNSIDDKIDSGEIPALSDLGVEEIPKTNKAVLDFKGGEDAAFERLNHYFWESDELKYYKWKRNGMLGADYSSKLSPWLSLGSLSPRTVSAEVERYELSRKKNVSTYWLIFELIWRDFWRFIAKKEGNKLFLESGIKEKKIEWVNHKESFERWKQGETGIPIIDANMRELNQTGFMSNRGRQLVASFLVNDLKQNWLKGAEYFESLLIDHDAASNYGNWQYITGIGNDPRDNRYFNLMSQAQKYDKKGEYVRYWCPELSHLEGFDAHHPDELSRSELSDADVEVGVDYPNPLVPFKTW